jgi:hypothetical protein
MFEFLLFVAACAVIVFLVANIQNIVNQHQSKAKLKPIKIEREDKKRPMPRQKRPY